MTPQERRHLLANSPLVGAIHDEILDSHMDKISNRLDLAAAFEDAVCWIAELQLQIELAQKHINKVGRDVSSGYIRKDTSHLTMLHPEIKGANPVDDDSWLKTGVEEY